MIEAFIEAAAICAFDRRDLSFGQRLWLHIFLAQHNEHG